MLHRLDPDINRPQQAANFQRVNEIGLAFDRELHAREICTQLLTVQTKLIAIALDPRHECLAPEITSNDEAAAVI